MTTHNGPKALVLTVGTGDADEIEKTLLIPMRKSINDGEWTRVVLLPSRLTENSARVLQERSHDVAVEIKLLPQEGQENNADRCFEHFDAVLSDLISTGFKPDDLQVDFTRGTKAMSAALVLAAVGRGLRVLRYVFSNQRDARGMVIPGTERVGQVLTTRATTRRRLDQAKTFMRQGDFSTVIDFLPDPQGSFFTVQIPEAFRSEVKTLRAAAHIYAAWDRLDYTAAVQVLERLGSTVAQAGDFAPTEEMEKWLRRLKQLPERANHAEMAGYLRYLACDLLANAERRLRDRHFEDALLRAYRVLELVGQIRLFDQGYDSASLPLNDENIRPLSAELRKDKRTGKATAGRDMVTRLLELLKDRLATPLKSFVRQHRVARITNRNESVLSHGFTATAPSEKAPLVQILDDLEKLLREDYRKADDRLKIARSLSFSGK